MHSPLDVKFYLLKKLSWKFHFSVTYIIHAFKNSLIVLKNSKQNKTHVAPSYFAIRMKIS